MLLSFGLWAASAGAAEVETLVALKVSGPRGDVMLQDELVMPSERVMAAPDGKHSLGVYIAAMDNGKALVELVAGKPKDGKPKPKVSQSFELSPFELTTKTLVYKSSTWTVEAALGSVWDAPSVEEAPSGTDRFVLAWDDAKMIVSMDPKAAKKPENVVVERELPDGRSAVLEQASPMKVIEPHEATHVIVETIPEPGPGHCQLGGPASGTEPAKYYVALTDFVPRLTSREVTGRFPDGTGYRVAAGVPVTEESEGHYRVQTGGLSFVIEATKDDLAFYYRPSTHFGDGSAQAPMTLKPGVIGTTQLGEVQWTREAPAPVLGLRGVATPIATLRVPCAEVRIRPDVSMFGE